MEKDNNYFLEFFGLQNLYNHALQDYDDLLSRRRSFCILMKRSLKMMEAKVNELIAGI